MDMQSLNTSLPRTTPHKRNETMTAQPSQDLLSSFKAAALSVTTLYKVAAVDQAKARAAGYQDALEDLLRFMEQDRIGFTEGEGSRIRQWTIERIDGSATKVDSEDDDDEAVVDEDKQRASSPDDMIRSQTLSNPREEQRHDVVGHDPAVMDTSKSGSMPVDSPTTFNFSSGQTYPRNHQRAMSTDTVSVTSDNATKPNAAVRVEYIPRPPRSRNGRNSNQRQTTTGKSGNLGPLAGSKRRLPLGDFFDLGGLSFDGKDLSDKGGGKRARHQ